MAKDIIAECYLPSPLSSVSTGNKKADEAIVKLAAMAISAYSPVARPSGKEYDKVAKVASSVGAKKLLAVLDDQALQIGNCVHDEKRIKKLAPSKKKEYQKAYDAAIHARKGRIAFLGWLFEQVMPEGENRLLEIVRDAKRPPTVRSEALDALWLGTKEKQKLLALAKLFDIRKWDGKDLESMYRTCLRCWFDADAKVAFDELKGLLTVANVKKSPGKDRAEALIGVVMHLDDPDPRWAAAIAPLAATDVNNHVFMALEKLPPDPKTLDVLLATIGKPEKVDYWHDDLVTAIGRIATPKAIPYLAYALHESWMHYPAAFEGFSNAKDPSAIPIMRAWLVENSTADRAKEAAKIIKGLLKFGPEPTAAKPGKSGKAAEPVRARPTLVFKKAKAFKAPKLPPIAKQEAEYTKMFEAAGIPNAMKILQRAVALIPKRVEEKTLALGVTKLGGHPDLPADMAWPRLAKRPLTFLAQLKLDELAKHLPKDSPLPKSGYLALFTDNDPLGDSYLEHAKAIFTKAGSKLVRHEVPEDFTDRIYQACACELVAKLSMPTPSNRHVTKALDKADTSKYGEDVFVGGEALPQVLGYRDHEYDAEEPASAQMLLQLTGDDQSDMEFGDCDYLSFFIDGKKLAKGDFSKIWPHVGD